MLEPLSVHIQLLNIHCYDEGDGIGSAEPYLWAVFFKIDGDSAFVDENFNLQGTAKTFGTLGDHGNLIAHDVDAGEDVPIPAQFGYGDTLRPIPLRVPVGDTTQVGGVIGCIVILLEEDETPGSAVAKGHAALGIAVQQALNDLIPTLNAGHLSPTDEEIDQLTDKVGSAVEDAIAAGTGVLDWISAFGNMDDKVGSVVFKFSSGDLLDAGPTGIILSKRWHSEGDWELTGEVKVDWSGWEDLGGPPAPPLTAPKIAAAPAGAAAVGAAASGAAEAAGAGEAAGTVGSAVSAPAAGLAGIHIPGGPVAVLNREITSAPAVASWQENRLDCFTRGHNNHMWQRSWDGAAWSDWSDLGGPPVPPVVFPRTQRKLARGPLGDTHGPLGGMGEQLASSPAAVSWGPNRIDAFARGMDRAMWHRWFDGGAWSGWESLGGNLSSAPAVASWAANRLDCFVQGPSDRMWHKWYDNGWSDWEDLGGLLTSAPAAVAWGLNRLDTFVRGGDNHLWHKWYDNGWSDWEDLGGILSAAPAVASRGENKLDVFVRGADSHLWLKAWTGANWTDWQDLGGSFTDAPAAVSWGSNRIDAFVRGGQSHMFHRWWG